METQQINKCKAKILLAILILFQGTSIIAQTKWLNFTNTDNVNDIAFQGDFVWVGTSGGLIKLDQVTGEQLFYNRANSGLPSNGISTLCFDSEDNLWVGTFNDGLAKFDGVGWQVFNEENSELRYNSILTLTCDKDGIIWIGTTMGLNRYKNKKLVNDLDVQGILRFIEVVDSGIVYLSFTNGIFTLKNNYQNLGEHYRPNNDLSKLCEAHSFLMINPNEFWVGYEDGLFHYHNKSWNKISNALLGFENRNIVTALCFDNQNNLWIGSFYGSISKYNGVNAENFNSKNSELPSGAVNKIRLDQKGNIWVCSSSGLYKYAEGWQNFNISHSLISRSQSLEVFSDNKQNVWLTNQGILYSYNKETVQKFDPSNSKFINVGSMVFDKENKMWIGDHEGLSMYDGEKWYRFDTLATILLKRDKEIFEIYKDTNWVKENYKNYLLEDEIQEDTSEAKGNYNFVLDAVNLNYWNISSYVTHLFMDNNKTLWFSTSDAVVSFNGTNWFLYDTANTPIPSTQVSEIVGDNKNNIWISTWDNGLIKFDRNNWIIYDTTNSPLVNNRITMLEQFDDLLFIGTDSGMMTFDGVNWKEFGPSKNKIKHSYCMLEDQKGDYWIGASDGLYKYDGKNWKIFNTSTSGIADNYITSLSIDYSGNLWIVSANRYLSIFNENGIKDESRINLFLNP